MFNIHSDVRDDDIPRVLLPEVVPSSGDFGRTKKEIFGKEIRVGGAAGDQPAVSVPDTGGVYFVPAFVGLGAPHWDPDTRGTILGITRGTTRANLIRAALESIAFQSYDLIEAIEKDSGQNIAALKVDGGASLNSFLMQFQADLLGIPVQLPVVAETTALGAAYLAGLHSGYWSGKDDIRKKGY